MRDKDERFQGIQLSQKEKSTEVLYKLPLSSLIHIVYAYSFKSRSSASLRSKSTASALISSAFLPENQNLFPGSTSGRN